MIKINKEINPLPTVLLTSGIDKLNQHITDYVRSPSGYHLNSRERIKFTFDENIYTEDQVKTALKQLQGHKCCFCESKVDHISYGHIEHFRPKAAYKQDEDSRITYPGYFWLAYEWSNLFFCCEICNGRGQKDNYFPLEDNSSRANPTRRDISNEKPLFLEPSGSGELDPEKHIYFIQQNPTHHSENGRITIKYLKLDREELNLVRETSLRMVQALENIVLLTKDSENADKAKLIFLDTLRDLVQSDSQYSNMFKSNFSIYLTEL